MALALQLQSSPRLTETPVLISIFRSTSVLVLLAAISFPAVTHAQHHVSVGVSYGYPGFWYGWGGAWGPWGPGWAPYPGLYPYPYVVDPFSSSVKFTVLPKDAEVYVDGALAGKIDDFDGRFQSLKLPPGTHEIVVYREGYRSAREHLYIESYDTKKLKFDLEKLGAGEQQEARPEAPPPPETPAPMRRGPRMPPPQERREPAETQTQPTLFGTLSIRVIPSDAEVYVDGERWTGPATSDRLTIRLATGKHRIEVRKEGFATYAEEVLIRQSATLTLNISLK